MNSKLLGDDHDIIVYKLYEVISAGIYKVSEMAKCLPDIGSNTVKSAIRFLQQIKVLDGDDSSVRVTDYGDKVFKLLSLIGKNIDDIYKLRAGYYDILECLCKGADTKEGLVTKLPTSVFITNLDLYYLVKGGFITFNRSTLRYSITSIGQELVELEKFRRKSLV